MSRTSSRRLVPLLALVLVAAAPSPQADDLTERLRERIEAEELYRQTAAITRYDRLSGGAGENAAIDHVVETLRAEGIEVEVHSFEAWTSDPVSAAVTVPGAAVRPEAITVAYSGSVAGLEAPLVDVGDADRFSGWIDPSTGALLRVEPIGDAPELEGAIALVRGLPVPETAWVLESLGAAGAVFVNPEDKLNELITTTVWGTPGMRDLHRDPTLPVAQVRASAGGFLAEVAAKGGKVRLDVETDTSWKTLRLPVARIMPSSGAPYVLLGGHIDSWHYGATDEGASNAAMVELARAFHAEREHLRRGLVVAWWPGHSTGRYAGSTWFADHFYSELRDRAIAYLNVDGIGMIDASRFSVAATSSLEDLALDVIEDVAGSSAAAFRPGRNSDQAFNGIGLSLLQFNHSRPQELGGYAWWHTPEDTIDKIDPEVLELDTELYAAALARLLTAPRPPIDLVAGAREIRDWLGQVADAGSDFLDMSRTLELADELIEEARRLERAGGAEAAEAVDRVRVLRPIHRVLYTMAGPYHPDPATAIGTLPGMALAADLHGMDPARRGFALTTLVRERNRVEDALRRALDEIRSLGG